MTPGNFTVWGTVIGLLVAIAIVTGGIVGFLLAVVFGAAGLAIGAHFDGLIDLTALRKSGRS
ncbi:hypothetical protein TPAU25S_03388 [Tsukamurella paurometabola]|uniref:DUF2273 domain-containing protein n=1 Tax=Tsukamurella paurometabola (strain ATCC 8368 / DSM 20162 / CCUG 35730 / CIP 100753 / JCM 10117 / KCTC 9821 / NBRC 16120 / NCIMB 702349 / NCTC 13040) TaxID=521096 RepID=D5UQV2_TSUPD|nr:hypothetical protein [Tsukamurella paurometabola]ADG76935.1 conserved hypothetical protein [Tsukamurella paurometabola DSM 20162]SUP42265.1 Uncharacterised protein [Tsukamurella paurometabola]